MEHRPRWRAHFSTRWVPLLAAISAVQVQSDPTHFFSSRQYIIDQPVSFGLEKKGEDTICIRAAQQSQTTQTAVFFYCVREWGNAPWRHGALHPFHVECKATRLNQLTCSSFVLLVLVYFCFPTNMRNCVWCLLFCYEPCRPTDSSWLKSSLFQSLTMFFCWHVHSLSVITNSTTVSTDSFLSWTLQSTR